MGRIWPSCWLVFFWGAPLVCQDQNEAYSYGCTSRSWERHSNPHDNFSVLRRSLNNSSYRYEKLHTKSLIRTLSTKTKLQYRTWKVSNVLKRDSLILLRLKFVSQPLILTNLRPLEVSRATAISRFCIQIPLHSHWTGKNVLPGKTSPGSNLQCWLLAFVPNMNPLKIMSVENLFFIILRTHFAVEYFNGFLV